MICILAGMDMSSPNISMEQAVEQLISMTRAEFKERIRQAEYMDILNPRLWAKTRLGIDKELRELFKILGIDIDKLDEEGKG